jgi:hypothetical protein
MEKVRVVGLPVSSQLLKDFVNRIKTKTFWAF